MLKVGITGGIGTGKSQVLKIFTLLGVPTIDADKVAQQLLNEDEVIQAQLIAVFGQQAYQNGVYNKSWIAEQIFNESNLRNQLNQIVHPPTIKYMQDWLEAYEQQKVPYVIKEAAIMIETGSYQEMDWIIGVTAPKELRVKRVMERNQISKQQVLAIMEAQWPEEKKRSYYHYIIENDEKSSLIQQVIAIHQELMGVSKT